MLCTALTVLTLFAAACTDAVPQSLADQPPSFNIENARSMINAHRARHGLGPLHIDARLVSAAKAHSSDLSRRGRVSHQGSDGTYPKDRARHAGYNARLASENVAAGYSRTEDVIRGWQGSHGHNANLLRRDAVHMGMALVYNPKVGKQTYWTLLVGAPRNAGDFQPMTSDGRPVELAVPPLPLRKPISRKPSVVMEE